MIIATDPIPLGEFVESMVSKYLSFSISIAFISWLVGMAIGFFLRKTAFYQNKLSRLNFIRSDKVNRLIGVGALRWIVKNTFFKFFNQKLKLEQRVSAADLVYLRNEMTVSETDHLIAFVFVSMFAVVKFARAEYIFGAMIMTVNILMNLYPSLLQQQNKRRIDLLTKRYHRK